MTPVDTSALRTAFGRADVKTVWLSVPALLDEVERLRARLDDTLNTLGLMADAYPLGSATRNTLEDECRDIRAALGRSKP